MGRVVKQDVLERVNFLYQAAHAAVAAEPRNVELSRHYCTVLLQIARHGVLRLDPHLKRRICKKCQVLLVPGLTARARAKSRRGDKRVTVTCLECDTSRRFLTRPDYRLWYDDPRFDVVPAAQTS